MTRCIELVAVAATAAVFGLLSADAIGKASEPSASLQRHALGVRLPTGVRCYRDSVNAGSLNRLTACFAPGGLVIDVSRRFRGRRAIRAWAKAEVIGGKLTIIRRIARPRNPRGTTYLVRFAPGGSGGFLAHYRFETRSDKIWVADLQYPD